MIKVHAFKRKKNKEAKKDYQFGEQWKVPSLVTLGFFHVKWPLDSYMLGGS
jgi:hypothetical protein